MDMEWVQAQTTAQTLSCAQLAGAAGRNRPVTLHGQVQALRCLGDIVFVVLRLRDGLLQCVLDNPDRMAGARQLREEATVKVSGLLREEARAPGGYELHVADLDLVSLPGQARPLPLNRKANGMSLDAQLNWRPLMLRHQDQRDRFRIQAGLCRAMRDFLHREGFTEIHTPKLVSAGAEGGSNIFRLDYFGQPAFLAQSPQVYKQTMVGVYERVFEVGPVFRAEKHNTVRHLNEYTSLDFEMGFIDSFRAIMGMEAAMLQAAWLDLAGSCRPELERLGLALEPPGPIPAVCFADAKRKIQERTGWRSRDPNDLEPEEERLIGLWARETYGSDWVFVTHYPTGKRPFYAMDDPEDPRVTLSFDLLYRGIEVTTGGQRIHDYDQQVAKMRQRGLDPEDFATYLMAHAYGLPPHGGLGIGLERLQMALTEVPNIRQAALFPRDMKRLTP